MKKIGILTYHRSINYGAFMQAFSLSKNIKKRFPDVAVEIIDYSSQLMEELYKPKISFNTLKNIKGYLLKKKQYTYFKDALNRLPLSQKNMCSDGNTDEVLSFFQNDYDIFVVGSDAVWNWCRRGFPNPYLMNFEKPVMKMSYAASAYGMDASYIGEEEAKYFKSSLEKFSFIGTRDNYTADMVRNVCSSAEPVFTCDPTVILNMDDVYNEIGVTEETFKTHIFKKLKIEKDKKLIGIMGAPKEIICKLKEKIGDEYVLVNLYNYSRFADKQLIDLTPFEWAVVFSLFEVTVTSYFHGTLLSLRNYTPVVNYDFNKFSQNNEGKICDVMRKMELSECHFKEREDYDDIVDRVFAVIEDRESYVLKIKKSIEKLSESSEVFFDKVGELLK